MRVSGGEEQKTIWMFAALLFVNTNLKNNPYFCGLQVNKASWKLSLRSHWERVKTETCFASGENQRKAHTLAVNNDQQHEPNSLCIARATVPPGDRLAELQRGKNVREREREREREWVSQWPMCQRDECWKLLGKRITAVYVGQVAHCQLLKCANFLKLQSCGFGRESFSLYLPSTQDWMDGCALFKGKTPSASAPTSTRPRSTPKKCAGSKTSRFTVPPPSKTRPCTHMV